MWTTKWRRRRPAELPVGCNGGTVSDEAVSPFDAHLAFARSLLRAGSRAVRGEAVSGKMVSDGAP